MLPKNIEKLLTPVGLAHWIMGDGYFDGDSVRICTDNFTKHQVLELIKVLQNKFGLKATIRKRSNPNTKVVWRISISKLSLEQLKNLIVPYLIPEMF